MPTASDSLRELRLGETYTRQEVHDIFSPETQFHPQAGTWGLQGIVRVPDRPGDFVFFVTYGKSQGAHVFDESVTEDGVLTWQSQPSQKFTDKVIQEFIHHDDLVHTIHLFLRTKQDIPYTYLGPLGYLEHDNTREEPVHFQWQILTWPLPPDVVDTLDLELLPSTERTPTPALARGLTLSAPPDPGSGHKGQSAHDFSSKKQARHPGQDAKNKALGNAGEELVLAHEIKLLRAAGRDDLADAVVHVARVEGDSAGYDIRSYTAAGDVRHIEVKTTRGTAATAFYATAHEVEFSRLHPDTYRLYRLYEYDDVHHAARFYVMNGPLGDGFLLEPNEYRVFLKPANET